MHDSIIDFMVSAQESISEAQYTQLSIIGVQMVLHVVLTQNGTERNGVCAEDCGPQDRPLRNTIDKLREVRQDIVYGNALCTALKIGLQHAQNRSRQTNIVFQER